MKSEKRASTSCKCLAFILTNHTFYLEKRISSVCRCCAIFFRKELKFGICAPHIVCVDLNFVYIASSWIESKKWEGAMEYRSINENLNGTWSCNSIEMENLHSSFALAVQTNRKKDETVFYYLDLNAFVSYKFYGRHSVLPEIYREPRKQISYPTHPHTYTRSRDISGMLDTLRFYLKL